MVTKSLPLADDIQNKFYHVDHRRLVVDEGFIEREDYSDVGLIKSWIKANGIKNLNPLKCYKRGDQYVIRRGSRRNMAIQEMAAESGEIMMVPIILIQKSDNLERQYFEQATENEGKPYTPWEKAKVLKKARNEYGWSETKMAQESGWSLVYIRRLLSLADAPERLIQLVRSGKVRATLAMDEIEADKVLEKKGETPVKVTELIEKAEQNALPPVDTQSELFPPTPQENNSSRTTRSDLQKPVSFKKMTKWVSKIEEKKLPQKKLEVLNFVREWLNGNLSEEYFNEYFS